MKKIREELDFVGGKKRLPWFNQKLTDNFHFMRIVKGVREKRVDITLRTILYSILPITEYVASQTGKKVDRENGGTTWTKLFQEEGGLIHALTLKYGMQGNIPQRSAVVLDYFTKAHLFPNCSGTIVELGCSIGLLGRTLSTPKDFFSMESARCAHRYFWLTRMPRIRASYNFSYIGYDRVIPPPDLVPFFVWDTDKRKKVVDFTNTSKAKGELIEGTFEDALERVCRMHPLETVVILTSFVLYQLPHPEHLVEKIQRIIHAKGNVHWLDLSRNNGIDCLFAEHRESMRLVPNHNYLSHNGYPVAKIINGSDDCPDWEYLE